MGKFKFLKYFLNSKILFKINKCIVTPRHFPSYFNKIQFRWVSYCRTPII